MSCIEEGMIDLNDTTWSKKASDLLRNLNFYRTSIQCMRELTLSDPSEELADRLRQTERTVACIELAMTMLTDNEQLLLNKMFINAGENPVDDICEEYRMEKSNIYRLRKRALDKFTMAIYGR